jgi:tetratricopeptide (TPR) repeat protein
LVFVREALRLAQTAGNARRACMCSVNLAGALSDVAEFDEASHFFAQALETGRKLALPHATLAAFICRLFLLADLGTPQDVTALMTEGQQVVGATGDIRSLALLQLGCARIALRQHDLQKAANWAAKACQLAIDLRSELPQTQAVLSQVHFALGRPEEGLKLARAAYSGLVALARTGVGDSLIRLAHAEALHATGDNEGARRAITDAKGCLLARAAAIRDSERRTAYLTRILDHARTIELARHWLDEGD